MSQRRTSRGSSSEFGSGRDAHGSATLGALATQENDANANQLILIHAGEPQPLPVPSSSTLPANILHVDLFALEYNLLRRAQAEQIPGTPDRQVPLTSLASLLQALQIPVPPMIPLGNAGNEAYYTLLAFQKLMMAETRLPELLFSNEGYVAHMPSMPSYPSFPYMPHSIPHIPMMPPPLPHPRRTSQASIPRPTLQIPTSPPRSPRRHSGGARQVSDSPSNRPRPASYGDTFSPTRAASHDLPSSARDTRPPVQRSQTVYWDDAGYAETTSPEERSRESSLRPVPGHRASEDSTKGSRLPPSSFRNTNGDASRLSSRSISWEKPPTTERRQSSSSPVPLGTPTRGRQSSTSLHTSSAPTSNSASGSSPRRPYPGNMGPNTAAASSGSGSSLKLSYDSKSSTDTKESNPRELPPSRSRSQLQLSSRGQSEVDLNNTDGSEGEMVGSRADRQKGSQGKVKDKGKLKSERSVKDLAGALARFWVG